MRCLRSALLLCWCGLGGAISNGKGRTPPMGWRSWNLYGSKVNQSLIVKVMDGLVARTRHVDGVLTSLYDLGFRDVGLDDAWQVCAPRDHHHEGYRFHSASGEPRVNTNRFPDLGEMTAHAHKLGLTAGWYLNNCICKERRKATHEMYQQDVAALVGYKFDSVKIDHCGTQQNLDLWSDLISQSGRDVLIENCGWGEVLPTKKWCPWNYYRTSGDVRAVYASVVENLQSTIMLAREGLSFPGCWAYPDMLQVGCKHGPGGASDKGLSFIEARSHFGAWCIVSSPLVLSNDPWDHKVLEEVWPIISNKEAIYVNQAWAGHSGSPFKESEHQLHLHWKNSWQVDSGEWYSEDRVTEVFAWQFFYKPIGEDRVAVLMMNHDDHTVHLDLDFSDVPTLGCTTCHVRDVWEHQSLGVVRDRFHATIASHDSVFLVLSRPQDAPRAHLEAKFV